MSSLGLEGEDATELYALAGLQSPHGVGAAPDPREVMRPAQLQAMHRLFAAHEPLPALAVDRHWNVVASNEGARVFGALAVPEGNLVETFFEPASRERLANWSASAQALLGRLRADMRLAPDDRHLAELHQRFASRLSEPAQDTPNDPRGIVVTLETPVGQVAFISLGASFTEATLRPALRFELFYPADERSEQRLERWSRQVSEVR